MVDSSCFDLGNNFSNAQDWFNYGCELCDLEQYEKAIAAFDKAIEFDTDHFETWFNKAAILHRLERYEEAIASYTKVIEINPDYSDAWFNRGLIFEYHLENHTSALENYDKATELDPENPDVWEQRQYPLRALGRYDEAEVSYAKHISIDAKRHLSLAVPRQKLQAVAEPVVIDGHTDFTKAFCDGYTFYQNYPYFGLSEVTFSTYEIGELNLTSGRIVACDPSLEEALRHSFAKSVEPGRYSVFLSVAYPEVSGYANIACVMLRFRTEAVTRWELAQISIPGSAKCGEVYGVDSGKGCFMDLDAAEVLHELIAFTPEEEADINAAWLTQDAGRTEAAIKLASDRAWHRSQQWYNCLSAEMDNNATRPPGERWACIQVSDRTQANIIAFSTGCGDGAYASYWGYDEAENLVSLVSDFALFPSIS